MFLSGAVCRRAPDQETSKLPLSSFSARLSQAGVRLILSTSAGAFAQNTAL